MANYLNKSELKIELVSFQQSGILSDALISMIMLLADGCCRKYAVAFEDAQQECFIHFLKIANSIDVERDCFNYLTTCFINNARQHNRKERIAAKCLPATPLDEIANFLCSDLAALPVAADKRAIGRINGQRTCTKCKERKLNECFEIIKKTDHEYIRHTCRQCRFKERAKDPGYKEKQAIRHKAWRIENKEERAKYQRERRAKPDAWEKRETTKQRQLEKALKTFAGQND